MSRVSWTGYLDVFSMGEPKTLASARGPVFRADVLSAAPDKSSNVQFFGINGQIGALLILLWGRIT